MLNELDCYQPLTKWMTLSDHCGFLSLSFLNCAVRMTMADPPRRKGKGENVCGRSVKSKLNVLLFYYLKFPSSDNAMSCNSHTPGLVFYQTERLECPPFVHLFIHMWICPTFIEDLLWPFAYRNPGRNEVIAFPRSSWSSRQMDK